MDPPISLEEAQRIAAGEKARLDERPAPSRHHRERVRISAAVAAAGLLAAGAGALYARAGEHDSPHEMSDDTSRYASSPAAENLAQSVDVGPRVPSYTGSFPGFCPFYSPEGVDRAVAALEDDGRYPGRGPETTTRICLGGILDVANVGAVELTMLTQSPRDASFRFESPSGEAGLVELQRTSEDLPWLVRAIVTDGLSVDSATVDAARASLTVEFRASSGGHAVLRVETTDHPAAARLLGEEAFGYMAGTPNVVVVPVARTLNRGEDVVIRLTDGSALTMAHFRASVQ
jgi:hypothetical protein